ncbi:TPA: asparagine synthase (glutamine-hydrolyzing) [bacterium]|nr:MAG: asparagine synthase (glutamine-hydrolyzing) [Candidatus Hydrogenedentes bacterium CG1_02_42_14]HBW46661.1 asparagine synthase (glutamine-hydrolyzing) [bacterium]
MCGIAAIFAEEGSASPALNELERMADELVHRGPDDVGYYVNERIGLAHRRLSIIDIACGHQPISNEDETVWIIFNGEIYNFMLLRKELESKGHKFKSSSDTEVLVHLYEEKGIEMLHDLRGVFAFAIWDSKRERLFAARDRFGEKPLVWAEHNGRLYLASEIASLLSVMHGEYRIDKTALYRYLVFQAPVAPLTILEGINRLQAGHRLVAEKGRVRVERYWDLPFPEEIVSEQEAEEQIWNLLLDAVKIQQVSERPLGFFLSGGIDSTLIVAAARSAGISPIKTYSVVFPGTSYDESRYSDEAARRLETEHHRVEIDFDVKDLLPLLMRRFGEPFGDPSCVPTYAVSKAAKEHVTVVLSGDGGDEFAGGYRTYLPLQAARIFKTLPEKWQDGLSDFFASLGKAGGRGNTDRIARLLSVLARGSAKRSYSFWRTRFPMAMANEILRPEMIPDSEELAEFGPKFIAEKAADLSDPVEGARRCDIRIQLAELFCPKVDISSSANALEVREPFLDPVLCEWSEKHLPSSLRVRGRVTKRISKKLLGRFFPPEFIHRKKAGFTPPYDDWFRGKNGEWAADVLLSERARNRGWFRPNAVETLLSKHQKREANLKETLFLILAAELWAREILDRKVL